LFLIFKALFWILKINSTDIHAFCHEKNNGIQFFNYACLRGLSAEVRKCESAEVFLFNLLRAYGLYRFVKEGRLGS